MKSIIKLILKLFPRPFLIKMSMLFRKPISFMYKGNNVECTVCEKSFKKFLPYGYGTKTKDNRLCPYCLSLERHRLLWLYLHTQTNMFSDQLKVLHIAPEQPYLKFFKKAENLEYITADLESPIADVHTDIRNMNVFDDAVFDVVICNHVLEHIDEEKKALAELNRVMKKDAWAILQVPINYELENTFEDNTITNKKERERIFGQYDHVRVYGRDYPDRLRKAGFTVKKDAFIKSFTTAQIEKHRFDPSELIYVCTK
jgi:SAM-dependent methyltransferase